MSPVSFPSTGHNVSFSMVQLLPLVCPHQAVSCAEAEALSLFCSPGPGMLDEQ